VTPLALLGALAIGVSLGLLGSGGSILTVPVLVFLAEQPEKLAIGGSLGIVGTVAAAGAAQYAWHRLVDWRSVLFVGFPAMAGSYLGAWVSQFVSGRIQLLTFAAIAAVAAFRMLRARDSSDRLREVPCQAVCLAFIGLGLGAVSGFVGIGGGFLIVPALVLLGGLPMRSAVGTSLVIIAMSAFTGFAKHLHLLQSDGLSIDWRLLGTFTALGVLGSVASQWLGARLPQSTLRRTFGVFLCVMTGVMFWETLS
jgi:uncharacterized membrane protein YfcA